VRQLLLDGRVLVENQSAGGQTVLTCDDLGALWGRRQREGIALAKQRGVYRATVPRRRPTLLGGERAQQCVPLTRPRLDPYLDRITIAIAASGRNAGDLRQGWRDGRGVPARMPATFLPDAPPSAL
jgi:hypothetical protein